MNNGKIVVNLFGVIYTTNIVQIVHGHVFESGELIGMIFRTKNGRAIPNVVFVVVVVAVVSVSVT